MCAPKQGAIITFCVLAMHDPGVAVETTPLGMAICAAILPAMIDLVGLLGESFAVVVAVMALLVVLVLDTVFGGVRTIIETAFQRNTLSRIDMELSNVADVTTC